MGPVLLIKYPDKGVLNLALRFLSRIRCTNVSDLGVSICLKKMINLKIVTKTN